MAGMDGVSLQLLRNQHCVDRTHINYSGPCAVLRTAKAGLARSLLLGAVPHMIMAAWLMVISCSVQLTAIVDMTKLPDYCKDAVPFSGGTLLPVFQSSGSHSFGSHLNQSSIAVHLT